MPKFSKHLPVVMKDLDLRLARKVVQVTAIAHSELIDRTPEDTGWARANWTPGLTAKTALVGTLKGDEKATSAQVSGANARSSHGLAQVLTRYKSIHQGIVYIVNNVPYVRELNITHKILPRFIERAIASTLQRASRLGGRGGGRVRRQ